MNKFLMATIILAAMGGTAQAQTTVSPNIVEARAGSKKAKGEIVVQNEGILPTADTLEVHGFTVSPDGTTSLAPLASTVSVDLSETSFRLGAKQSRSVDYTVDCHDHLPCWGLVLVFSSTGKTSDGLLIRNGTPQVFYICKPEVKTNNCRSSVRQEVFGLPKGK